MKPTGFQLDALRMAASSGRLRKLPGGFWVRGDYPPAERGHVPPQWHGTQTVQACAKRGWFAMESWHTAHLTDAGHAASNEEM